MHDEFFGPVGTGILTFAVPAIVYAVAVASTQDDALSLVPLRLPALPEDAAFFSWQGLAAAYVWFFGYLALHCCLPARRVEGVVEPTGRRWTYRLNGRLCFALVYATTAALTFAVPVLPLWWLADHFLELVTGAAVLSTSLALVLYAASHRRGAVLAASASGVPAYDFWMGRELHPRLGRVDLKEFCELYPGMAAWAVLNLSFAHLELVTTGRVSAAMLFVNAGQLLYIADSVLCEASILSTMDITTEGFGFMLAFGDLAWVPFVFTTQAKYIAERGATMPPAGLAAAVALNAVGYYIFRASNAQKDTFRRDPTHPSVRHLESMRTARGTRLICSGWWGAARHVNYTGDWLMGLSWCLACGFGSVVPYVYAAYFGVLLAHRERRDDAMCRVKYGADWDKYCKRVPWRLIPGVY